MYTPQDRKRTAAIPPYAPCARARDVTNNLIQFRTNRGFPSNQEVSIRLKPQADGILVVARLAVREDACRSALVDARVHSQIIS